VDSFLYPDVKQNARRFGAEMDESVFQADDLCNASEISFARNPVNQWGEGS
jgi:hypothetical protein